MSKDEREHVNIVFIGHVDAGKSTMSGQILLTTGQVDKRTMEKYEKEAKEKNRESWYLAYILDTSEEERERGKTVECGKAGFTTEKKKYTLLDAPGHKSYVPSMIAGASQADVGALVISARKGEFESGFEKGGQTLEHMMLAKNLGFQKLFLLINKMDDPTVQWSEERYSDITGKLGKALAEYGFRKTDYTFIPCSAFTGANVKDKAKASDCPWYKGGPSFFEALDALPPMTRFTDRALRIPVSARYKDMGQVMVIGKVETGVVKVGETLSVVPSNKKCTVVSITSDDESVQEAKSGENVIIEIKGLDDEELGVGHVLCPEGAPGYRSKVLEAQLMITDLAEAIPLLTAGYECILHLHTAVADVRIKTLVSELDRKTGKVKKEHPAFLTVGSVGIVRMELDDPVAVEKASEFLPLGRFTLRDKGRTIGIGRVLRIKPC